MTTSEGITETSRAPRYLTQLCRHMSNRGMDVDTDGATYGVAEFGFGTCALRAERQRLVMTLETGESVAHARAQQALTRDIERFARREGLTVTWTPVTE